MSSFSATEAFNIVLLYERSDLLSKAMATCSHLQRELDNEFTSDLRVWRIDIATSEEFAAEAGRDIAAAEVIILGVQGNQPCPPAFRRWREMTAPNSRGLRGAIIAIVEAVDEPMLDGDTWNNVLRNGATQIHPEIFVCEPPEEFAEAAPSLHADALPPGPACAMAGG